MQVNVRLIFNNLEIMKKILLVGFLFTGVLSLMGQSADTVIVTVNNLLKNRKNVIKINEGDVVLFEAKDQKKLNRSRISFKFWQEETQEEQIILYSKGKIIFSKRTTKENIHVISPVTGLLEVRLRSHGWIGAGIATVVIVYLSLAFL